MKQLKRVLIIISLIPIITVIIVSVFNMNKQVKVKFLTWTSPSMSLGLLMMIGGCTGAFITSAATLATNQEQLVLKRNIRINPNYNIKNNKTNYSYTESEDYKEFEKTDYLNTEIPERDLRDPLPTISVPYKIIDSMNNKRYGSNNYNEELRNELVEDYQDDYTDTFDNCKNENENEIIDDSESDNYEQDVINKGFNNNGMDTTDSDEGWGDVIKDEW